MPFPLSRITRWKMQRPSATVPLNLALHNTERPTAGKGSDEGIRSASTYRKACFLDGLHGAQRDRFDEREGVILYDM